MAADLFPRFALKRKPFVTEVQMNEEIHETFNMSSISMSACTSRWVFMGVPLLKIDVHGVVTRSDKPICIWLQNHVRTVKFGTVILYIDEMLTLDRIAIRLIWNLARRAIFNNNRLHIVVGTDDLNVRAGFASFEDIAFVRVGKGRSLLAKGMCFRDVYSRSGRN